MYHRPHKKSSTSTTHTGYRRSSESFSVSEPVKEAPKKKVDPYNVRNTEARNTLKPLKLDSKVKTLTDWSTHYDAVFKNLSRLDAVALNMAIDTLKDQADGLFAKKQINSNDKSLLHNKARTLLDIKFPIKS